LRRDSRFLLGKEPSVDLTENRKCLFGVIDTHESLFEKSPLCLARIEDDRNLCLIGIGNMMSPEESFSLAGKDLGIDGFDMR
jgi:hypothetical protein